VFPAGEAAFRQMVKQSGEPENEYLLSLIELTSGKEPGPEVWVPTKQ